MEELRFAKFVKRAGKKIITDLEGAIRGQMEKIAHNVKAGNSIAITAGSRGIRNVSIILKNVCDFFKDKGAHPFIVSSMGSHGGGTVEGQEQILLGLGVTEKFLGVPLKISEESELIGRTEDGYRVYVDREVLGADGIFIVNRIKPHTAMKGEIGSGLLKMLAVGLGKRKGAEEVHSLGPKIMEKVILSISKFIINRLNVIGGLAIIENESGVIHIELVQREEFEEKEKKLFVLSKTLSPSLPCLELDLLVVTEMGKDISGTGMDANVIGRMRIDGIEEPDLPKIERIVVLRLSPNSDGNANGIGLADFTTKGLVKCIDWEKTLTNVISTGYLKRAFCPPFLETEKDAILWAIKSLRKDVPRILACIIKNTNEFETLWLSEEASKIAKDYEQASPFEPLRFGKEGELILDN